MTADEYSNEFTKLAARAEKAGLPPKIQAKLVGNVLNVMVSAAHLGRMEGICVGFINGIDENLTVKIETPPEVLK